MKQAAYLYITLFTLLLLLILQGCGSGMGKKKKTNWRPEYESLQKRPFSFYLAYQSLSLLFPNAKVEKLKTSKRINNLEHSIKKQKGGRSLIVLLGSNIEFNEGEADALFALVEQGNDVIIAVDELDKYFANKLKIAASTQSAYTQDSVEEVQMRMPNGQMKTYNHTTHDYTISNYLINTDTADEKYFVLGANQYNKPNCVLYQIGTGRLILHANPMVFTNYFLLENNNRDYLATLFSYVKDPIYSVYFYSFNSRVPSISDLGILWQHKATRAALIFGVVVLLLYILFEQKRRQKIIPEVAPVVNDSVAFVETIGRLYYNKKNHTNLAEKMIQHFWDFVRSNYYLDTSTLNEEFIKMLSAKSGQEIAMTHSLVNQIKDINNGEKVSEAALFSLYHKIQQYYNGT